MGGSSTCQRCKDLNRSPPNEGPWEVPALVSGKGADLSIIWELYGWKRSKFNLEFFGAGGSLESSSINVDSCANSIGYHCPFSGMII